ncbi:MAG TPA: J domain-containing protein [Chitinophagaceae bacterium]
MGKIPEIKNKERCYHYYGSLYLRCTLQAKDYYKILELPPSATLKEIKAAYRRLAQQYHPDKSGNDLYAAAQFEIIKEAYEILSNPSKKEYYLQQRWYHQSIGKKDTATAITPVTILKQVLELDKYVSTLDVHRMDKEGLYDHICNILSDDTIEKINAFKETGINNAIVDSVLKSSRTLPWKYAKLLSARLTRINTDSHIGEAINKYADHSRTVANWDTHKAWILLLIVLLLCLLIYLVSG